MTIKTLIGKKVDITQLKGVRYEDFRGHNKINELMKYKIRKKRCKLRLF